MMFGEIENPRGLGRGTHVALGAPVGSTDLIRHEPGYDVEVQETTFDLSQYWRLALKYRWLIASIFVASIIISLVATLLMTPIYDAETTLQIDRESARVVNVQSVEPAEQMVSGEEFYQTQYGLLRSRALAIRTIDSLNLAANDDFLKTMGEGDKAPEADLTPQAAAAKRRTAVIEVFQDNLSVAPIRGSRLVRLVFSSPDANLSTRVVNSTAENFITSNLDRRFESSSYARRFLEERLAQVKVKLEESERQIVAYATQQQIINLPNADGRGLGGTQSLTSSSLLALNTALSTARGERIKAEERWRQSMTTSGLGLSEVLENRTIQELTQARSKAEADYQDKLRTFKPDFPEMVSLRARITEMDRQIQAQVANVQRSLRNQYDVTLNQEKSFAAQVASLKSSVLDLRDRTIQYDILQREVDTNRSLYDGLLQRYKEIGVAGGISANNISIVDRAEPPEKPSSPRPLINLLIGAVAGLVIGLLVAILSEMFDESINSPEDVETKLGVALLGSVPQLDKGVTPKVSLQDSRSAFSEAYYSIRTALQFSTAEGVPASLLVTSARPAEGKSTSALAIATSLARMNLRVLLIDGDLRNPSMHRNFGGDNSAGFSNLLTGAASLAEIVQRTDLPTLTFIPCGPLPPSPAEILAGGKLKSIIAEAKEQYDVVVIDGPPVLGLADAPLLSSMVAGTIFVVEAGGTRRGLAKTALRRLLVGHARLVGVVLTKFNARKNAFGNDYAYAYSYEYGPRLEKK